jgi:hypothetical protein
VHAPTSLESVHTHGTQPDASCAAAGMWQLPVIIAICVYIILYITVGESTSTCNMKVHINTVAHARHFPLISDVSGWI